jgi:hypothetical protein
VAAPVPAVIGLKWERVCAPVEVLYLRPVTARARRGEIGRGKFLGDSGASYRTQIEALDFRGDDRGRVNMPPLFETYQVRISAASISPMLKRVKRNIHAP